jgi:formylglycine-generating enzyme required for sulfatase activity
LVFTPTPGPVDLRHLSQWWTWTPGASWRHPEGPRSSIGDRWSHPVVHVAHEDALAYASWVGGMLPSEAQWEFAARGGLDGAEFTWGDEQRPGGRIMANTWDGPDFPWRSTKESGFTGTSPVGSFPPNGYDLYDMAGNVWEWTDDWYTSSHPQAADKPCCVPTNPRGGPRRGQPRPGAAGIPGATQGDQRWLAPLRRHVLPSVPAGGTPPADDRHRHEPHRHAYRLDGRVCPGDEHARRQLTPARARCQGMSPSR